MSISFSGLASGLDTSSWVESLVALKKAKVETYEEEKSNIQTTQETLSKIKSFFTSFRSMLEKVTDAKFGVSSMDIFAQKLANSSDTSILTAAATTEAEEATYDVTVDKLATGTQAVSGFKNMTTIVQSETATMNTKLSEIGVKAGDIGVTVNGTKHTVTIGENDTISNFISKLKNIGVDAGYSEASGVFSVNLSASAIDDTITRHADGSVGTGIVKALHLESTGGYESADLKITNTETIVSAATGGTKLSELGTIKAGNIEVKANNASYTIAIDGNTTLASLINNLQSKGVEARLTSDGILEIKDAEIVDSGNTGIINALGLETDINSKTQTATGLKTVTITTTEVAATGSTKISELGAIKNGRFEVKANGTTYTITINQNTTLSELVSSLTGKGVDASLSSDGVFTIKNAEIVDSGNTGIVSALGLTQVVNNKSQSSGDLATNTVSTSKSAATSSTKIKSLVGGESLKDNDTVIVEDKSGKITTITLSLTSTIGDLVNGLNDAGLTAAIDSNGVFSLSDGRIKGGSFDVMKVLGLNTSQTVSVNATSDTKLSDITSERTFSVKDKDGNIVANVTLSNDATIESLFSKLSEQGISASISNGVITLNSANGNYITGALPKALGIGVQIEGTRTVTTGGTSTSGEPVRYETLVSGNTTVTIASTVTSSDKLTYSTVINSTTTSIVPVDITSSSGVYYTTITTIDTTPTPTPTPTPSETTEVTLVSSKAILTKSAGIGAGTTTGATIGTVKINTTTPQFVARSAGALTNAISSYNTIGIGSAEVLAQLATIVNEGKSLNGKTFVLTDDIDLSGYSSDTGWTPIGNSSSHTFDGNFNGNGHTISGLYIANITTAYSSDTRAYGLFGYASGGTIENVGLVEESITVNTENYNYVGGLVGYAYNLTINNCYTSGNISSDSTASSYAGGLVGYANSSLTINNCYTNCVITSIYKSVSLGDSYAATTRVSSAGGLVGYAYSLTISNCYAGGSISSNSVSNSYAGGLVGTVSDLIISNCYTTASISSDTSSNSSKYGYSSCTGGLVGYATSSLEISNCYTTGSISSNISGSHYLSASSYAGGLIGYASIESLEINNCYTSGNITSSNSTSALSSNTAGGLVGCISDSITISNCYASGSISSSGTKDSYAGGLVGSTEDGSESALITINNSYTSGSISSFIFGTCNVSSTSTAGGLIGYANYSIIISNSCATGSISSDNSIKNTYSSLTTSSTSGGLVGYGKESIIISNSCVTGSISSSNSSYFSINNKGTYSTYTACTSSTSGGLVGYASSSLTINNSYATGSISSLNTSSHYASAGFYSRYDSDSYAGGLVGYLNHLITINNCYTSGNISASNSSTSTNEKYYAEINSQAGGLIGHAETGSSGFNTSTVDNTFVLGQVSGDEVGAISGYIYYGAISSSRTYYNNINTNAYGTIKIDKSTTRSETALDASEFNQDLYESIGFGESNGWLYTSSSTTPVLAEFYKINANTTLEGLLGEGCGTQTLVVQGSEGYITITISASDSICKKFEEAGLETSIENDKVTLNGKIVSLSQDLADALGFDLSSLSGGSSSGGSSSGGSSSGGGINSIVTTIFVDSSSSDLALSSVGVNSTNYITVKNGNTISTVTVTGSTTVRQLTADLARVGITTDVTNGKFTFSGSDSCYILGMTTNLKSALNLMDSGGRGYTEKSEQTTSTQVVTLTSANTDIKMYALGVNGTNLITVQNGNTTATIVVDPTSTLADMTSALAKLGILSSIEDGKITFTGDDSHYIIGMSSNLANVLKLTSGSTYTTTVTATSTTQTLAVSSSNSTIKLSDIGATRTNYITVRNGSTTTIITLGTDSTIADMTSALTSAGISVDIADGRFTFSGDSEHYIVGISANLANILNMSVGNNNSYVTSVENTYGNTNSNVLKSTGFSAETSTVFTQTTSTSVVGATRDTLLSELGVTAGEFYVYTNGEKKTAVISSDETIGSFIDKINAMGIQAGLINNGSKSNIILNGSGDSYIAKSNKSTGTSNIVDTLFGGASAVVNESSYTGVESITTKVTATVGATESTALSSLGVTAGEYYIYNNGVKYTALISSEETLGSFMDTLKSFGIQTGLINNGGSASLILIGNGNSYVAKSNSVNNASNVVERLFGTSDASTSYSYTGSELLYSTVTHTTSATTDSLLSEFDTPWGNTTLKSAGDLVVMVNGNVKTLRIAETETFGTLVDKFKDAGIQADFLNGKLYITNAGDLSIIADRTTSSLFNANTNLRLTSKDKLNGFMSSTATVQSTTTVIEEHSASASAYADMNTKLSTLGIKGGSLSIYRNGEKALITIEDSHTLGDVRSLISKKFSNVDMKFSDDGKLVFYSTQKDVSVELGNTTDTSNFLAVTGVVKAKDGTAESARALYTVNGDSKVMANKIFRRGNVKAGSFFVGTERFEINANTTINDVISMINNTEGANATAYWDTIDGKLVIKSRSTGAALINIEAGTSNFTDIMGFTTSEWNKDGSVKVSKMNVDTQELGSNAQFRINGTSYTATSNIITSDITKIKGVTLNLNGLTSGSAIKVTVQKDKESVANALSDIVDSYNELMNNVDEAIAKEGALKNQTTLKMIRNQLRSLMTSSDLGATTFRNLSAIGISVEAASASNISTSNSSIINLNFDKDAFFKAYEADADAVKALLIGGKDNKGIFTNVETLVDNALQSVSGYFAVTENTYNKELTNWNTKITKANKEIDRYKSRLEKKFSSMDLTISNMQQQYSTFLS